LFENRYRCKDGSYRDLLWNASYSAQDRLIYATARDVTDLKKREQERHQRDQEEIERLRRFNEVKAEFINVVAHELYTPLTPMIIQAANAQRFYEQGKTAEGAHSLRVLRRNADRIHRLIAGIIDTLREEDETIRLSASVQPVRPLLEDVVEDLRAVALRKGVTVEIEASFDVQARYDRVRFHSAVMNIVENGIKFSPRGGRVTITADTVGDGTARISVHDQGPGIDPAMIDTLFERFVQAHDPATTANTGWGLGLYTAKLIVDHHAGRLWGESPGPGKGSSFHIDLPGGDHAG
jgi:signal transduction histidine kinase